MSERNGSDASFSGLLAHMASRTRSQHRFSHLSHVHEPRSFDCTIRMIPFNNQGSPFNNHCRAVFSTVSTHNSFPGVFQNCRTATWVIFRWSGKKESQTEPTLLDAAGRQLSNGGSLDRVGHLGETTRTKTRRTGVCLGAR